jgi:poly-beta-1,6-N-acetyl-D-glucosamine synthase
LIVLEIITFASIALFVGFYASYYVICFIYVRKKSAFGNSCFQEQNLPIVSLIVPVYNEAKIIQRKIENLQKIDYPSDKFEVVFVDGGSRDGTVEKIENSSKTISYSQRVIQQGSRKGFNSAVVEGFLQTTGEIIFITGAETEYAPDAVRLIVDYFANPKVGAVNGTMKINNVGAGSSTQIEASYRSFYDFIREAESKIDSPFDIKGEIAATRRSICQHIVSKEGILRKGCIDACFSFQAAEEGYRTVYEPRAVYSEPAPETMRDSFKQQIRRGATLIENMLSYKNMILRRKYGKFGLVIMPAHFLMLIVLPFFFFISVAGILLLTAFAPLNYLLIGAIILGLLGLVFSRKVQAFAKVQLVLIFTVFRVLLGIDTQKFERLSSVRPS